MDNTVLALGLLSRVTLSSCLMSHRAVGIYDFQMSCWNGQMAMAG
jgi:hypothetical protein